MNKHVHSPFTFDMPDALRGTPIVMTFAALLPTLDRYIRCEHDLADINYSIDPAYSEWHRESDEAQDRLIDVLRDLRSAPLGIAMDAPLRKLALLIHAMRCDPEHARALHQKMDAEFEARFRVPGRGTMAQHRKLLLSWVRPLIASFVALPIFDPEDATDGDDVERGDTPLP